MVNILIVDDSATMRKLIKNSLFDIGYTKNIQECANGQEALELIEQDKSINCIFLDINMPIMSGFELMNKLKEKNLYSRLDIILASTEVLHLKKESIDELDVAGVIPKPFKKSEFDTILIPLLDMIEHKAKKQKLKFENEILIVDDSISMRKIIKRQLENLGCSNIFEASNGREALEVVAEHLDINLMFVDIDMPIMNGIDLITQLDKTHLLDKIDVVMISNNEKELKKIEFETIVAKILKPFKQEDLKTKVLPILKGEHKTSKESKEIKEDLEFKIETINEVDIKEEKLNVEKLKEVDEIKLDYSVEDSIEIFLLKFKEATYKNPKILNGKKLDYIKMKRFIYTAYNHLIEIDISIKNNRAIHEALVNLIKTEKLYNEILKLKQLSFEVVYEKMFLNQQSIYVYFYSQCTNLEKNLSNDMKIAKNLYTNLINAKREIEDIKDKISNEYKAKVQSFKGLNKEYANSLHKISLAKKGISEVVKLLKEFREKYISRFELIYMDRVKEVEKELLELLHVYCYKFDYILWEKAKHSIAIKNFFTKSEIVGNYSSQTFLEYYLRSIDASKTSSENIKLFELLKYLKQNDNKSITIIGSSINEIAKMKSAISNVDKSYKIQGYNTFMKLLDGSLSKQDLIIIDYDMKNFNLYSFLRVYKRVHKIQDEKIKVVLLLEKYNKDVIIEAIENGVLEPAKKNFLIKPKHLDEKMLVEKVKSLV